MAHDAQVWKLPELVASQPQYLHVEASVEDTVVQVSNVVVAQIQLLHLRHVTQRLHVHLQYLILCYLEVGKELTVHDGQLFDAVVVEEQRPETGHRPAHGLWDHCEVGIAGHEVAQFGKVRQIGKSFHSCIFYIQGVQVWCLGKCIVVHREAHKWVNSKVENPEISHVLEGLPVDAGDVIPGKVQACQIGTAGANIGDRLESIARQLQHSQIRDAPEGISDALICQIIVGEDQVCDAEVHKGGPFNPFNAAVGHVYGWFSSRTPHYFQVLEFIIVNHRNIVAGQMPRKQNEGNVVTSCCLKGGHH